MKILVFDTCFNKAYIVLRDNNKIIKNEIIESTESNYHSAFIIPKIRDILKELELQIKDIDCIGINIGPGSFTGIRASITIARVLAQQYNIKLIGIDSLSILAKINNQNTNTAVILDARKNNVYFAKFSKNKEEITSPTLIEKDKIFSLINNEETIICDKSIYNVLKENNYNIINYEENDKNLGLYLSDIVTEKLNNTKEIYNWAKIKPLYLQKPSITKPKEIKNV